MNSGRMISIWKNAYVNMYECMYADVFIDVSLYMFASTPVFSLYTSHACYLCRCMLMCVFVCIFIGVCMYACGMYSHVACVYLCVFFVCI